MCVYVCIFMKRKSRKELKTLTFNKQRKKKGWKNC